MMRITGTIGLTLALAVGVAQAQKEPQGPAIEDGAAVQLEYTLTDEAGAVLDSNKGGNPLTYTQGKQQIIPGLEKALSGMRAGEERKVTVNPQEAYGEVDPKAVTEVPKKLIPPNSLSVGAQLVAQTQGGGRQMVRVKEIKEETVIIDLNHPLAGKTLYFDVKVLAVELPKVQPPPK